MKSIKSQAYFALLQIVAVLVLGIAAVFLNRSTVDQFFHITQAGELGIILNGLIVVLFAFGLLRIISLLMSYAQEQTVLDRFLERVRDKVSNPTYKLPTASLVVKRFNAVQTLAQQQAQLDQTALAAVTAAGESTRFTLVRFINNILILAGVFGTIISLSTALMGAASLLDSPDNLSKMGGIIGGMATALSTTLVAIVCYVIYSYFNMRLQDIRNQYLANLEETTTLYIMPRFRSLESNLLHDVAALTQELRKAAETVGNIQDRFLHAGERLQLAVSDLHTYTLKMGNSSEDLRVIRDSIREGFRLSEPKST